MNNWIPGPVLTAGGREEKEKEREYVRTKKESPDSAEPQSKQPNTLVRRPLGVAENSIQSTEMARFPARLGHRRGEHFGARISRLSPLTFNRTSGHDFPTWEACKLLGSFGLLR